MAGHLLRFRRRGLYEHGEILLLELGILGLTGKHDTVLGSIVIGGIELKDLVVPLEGLARILLVHEPVGAQVVHEFHIGRVGLEHGLGHGTECLVGAWGAVFIEVEAVGGKQVRVLFPSV